MKKSALILAGILVFVWLPALAQEPKPEESKPDLIQTYLPPATSSTSTIQEKDAEEVGSPPTQQPAWSHQDGEILADSELQNMYLISEGRKRHLPDPATFEGLDLQWDNIEIVSPEELAAIPPGEDVAPKAAATPLAQLLAQQSAEKDQSKISSEKRLKALLLGEVFELAVPLQCPLKEVVITTEGSLNKVASKDKEDDCESGEPGDLIILEGMKVEKGVLDLDTDRGFKVKLNLGKSLNAGDVENLALSGLAPVLRRPTSEEFQAQRRELLLDRFARRTGRGMKLLNAAMEREVGEGLEEWSDQALPILADSQVNQYIAGLGKRLLSNSLVETEQYKFRFYVVDEDVVNAFAAPGGVIYVYRGLLENVQSEAELAGILGHEIGHVIGRHASKAMGRQLIEIMASIGAEAASEGAGYITSLIISILELKFSRDAEREADRLGAINLYLAGYDPGRMADFFARSSAAERGKKNPFQALQSTHPFNQDRYEDLQSLINKLGLQGKTSDSFSFHLMKKKLAQRQSLPETIVLHNIQTVALLSSGGSANRLQKRYAMDTFGKKLAKSHGVSVINLEDRLSPALLGAVIQSVQLTGRLNPHLIAEFKQVVQADALLDLDVAGFRERKVGFLKSLGTNRTSNSSVGIGFTMFDSQTGEPVWGNMVSLYQDVGGIPTGFMGLSIPLGSKPPAFEDLADKAIDKAVQSFKKK